jgi:hypothetical protein
MTPQPIPIPDKITLVRTKRGGWICLIDNRSSGELCFDEMLGHVARQALGLSGYPMLTRQELEAQMRRRESQIDPTDTQALCDHEQYVAHRLAEDFPE